MFEPTSPGVCKPTNEGIIDEGVTGNGFTGV